MRSKKNREQNEEQFKDKKCVAVTISNIGDVVKSLKKCGLPKDYDNDDIQLVFKKNQGTAYIHDLRPQTCVKITNSLHGQKMLGKTMQVYPLVDDSPVKSLGENLEKLFEQSSSESEESEDEESSLSESDSENTKNQKRKFSLSPEEQRKNLSKKQRMKLKKQLPNQSR